MDGSQIQQAGIYRYFSLLLLRRIRCRMAAGKLVERQGRNATGLTGASQCQPGCRFRMREEPSE